ncbi:MAG: ribosome biogenesis GTP-binding protein YihA/YsxC [Oscillospiraceae bacterium]|jgi:GTP-binding protein
MKSYFSTAEFITTIADPEKASARFNKGIVMAGQSNSGKSSLINSLTNRKSLARVSSVPGKTYGINLYRLSGGAEILDVPGFGYAKRSKQETAVWADLMYRFFEESSGIELGILVSDIRRDMSPESVAMMDLFNKKGIPFIIVLTKLDKIRRSEEGERLEAAAIQSKPYGPLYIFTHSTAKKETTQELRKYIDAYLDSISRSDSEVKTRA